MDRKRDPSRIFYPHGWRELVNGSLEEGFGEYNVSEYNANHDSSYRARNDR